MTDQHLPVILTKRHREHLFYLRADAGMYRLALLALLFWSLSAEAPSLYQATYWLTSISLAVWSRWYWRDRQRVPSLVLLAVALLVNPVWHAIPMQAPRVLLFAVSLVAVGYTLFFNTHVLPTEAQE